MTNNTPDYNDNLAFEPKSADYLNEQRRQSDVLISAIEKCAKLEREVKQLRELLKECRNELQREYTNLGEDDLSLLTKIDEVLK